MLRKIYRELMRIRKELQIIRNNMESFLECSSNTSPNYIPLSSSGNEHTAE